MDIERPGSGDGERKTLLTRQIAFEPLPASVLLNEFAGASSAVADGEDVRVVEGACTKRGGCGKVLIP